jgi:hypothetical protein
MVSATTWMSQSSRRASSTVCGTHPSVTSCAKPSEKEWRGLSRIVWHQPAGIPMVADPWTLHTLEVNIAFNLLEVNIAFNYS